MKIIHLLCHSPGSPSGEGPAYSASNNTSFNTLGSSNEDDYKYYDKLDNPPYWAGYFQNDWHVRFASEIKKKNADLEIECWRLYHGLERVHSKMVNGIMHRLFPSQIVKFNSYRFGEKSVELIKELDKSAAKGTFLLHIHGLFTDTVNRILNSLRFTSIPIVAQHHGNTSYTVKFKESNFLSLKRYFNYYCNKLENRALKKIDYMFVLDESSRITMANKGYENVDLGSMGVDMNEYSPLGKNESRKRLGIDYEDNVIVSVGRLVEWKGVHKVLGSFTKLSERIDNLRYFIIYRLPDIIYEEKIKKYISDYDLEGRVILYPDASKEDLKTILSASDLFVLPSDSEPFGVVYIEALSHNLPVIATNNGGFHDFISNEEGIFFVDPKDTTTIENKIHEFFLNKEEYDLDFREIARNNFSWDVMVKKNVAVYKDLWRRYSH